MSYKGCTEEEVYIIESIKAARSVQEYLWSDMNSNAGLEELKRMLRKRVLKIEEITTNNPHFKVELKKEVITNCLYLYKFYEPT